VNTGLSENAMACRELFQTFMPPNHKKKKQCECNYLIAYQKLKYINRQQVSRVVHIR
jgi:hypothetical protein